MLQTAVTIAHDKIVEFHNLMSIPEYFQIYLFAVL